MVDKTQQNLISLFCGGKAKKKNTCIQGNPTLPKFTGEA